MITNLYQELVLELPAGTPIYLGAEYLNQHDAPPRIVMVPSTDTFKRTQKPVSREFTTGRPLWSRVSRVSFYLWAASYELIDALLAELSTAINAVVPAAEYIEGAYEEEGWVSAGYVYRFDMDIETFVVVAETYAVIEQIAGDCGMAEVLNG